jgi:hypothetical protein
MKVRERFVRGPEAVRPDQSAVFLDTPAIIYVPADHLLAVRGTAQHKALKGQ